MAEPTLMDKLSVKEKWIRFVFMILFVLITFVTRLIVWLVAGVQFLYVLFVGKPNHVLLPFGDSLSQYIYQIIKFLTFVTEHKPFPFDKWPEPKGVEKPKKVAPPPPPKPKD